MAVISPKITQKMVDQVIDVLIASFSSYVLFITCDRACGFQNVNGFPKYYKQLFGELRK